jgi:hypothetical protein
VTAVQAPEDPNQKNQVVNWTLKPDTYLNPMMLRQALQLMASFIKKVDEAAKERQGSLLSMPGQQSQVPQGSQAPMSDPTQGQTAPLNAANLKAHQQREQQRRQQQGNQQPAAAPQANQATVPLHAASPQGVPKYHPSVANKFDPNSIKLPPNKKLKVQQGSSSSSPVQASASSPQVPKTKSPEIPRQKVPEPPKPTHKCSVQECDFSVRGFSSQAELEKHQRDSHAPIEDPMNYSIEGVAEALGLGKDGKLKVAKVESQKPSKAASNIKSEQKPTSAPSNAAFKSGQTPNIKAEALTPAGTSVSTPMNRVPTQTGPKDSPLLKTPQGGNAKIQTPSTSGKAVAKDTPGKPMETAKSEPAPPVDLWANADFTPSQLDDLFDMDLPGTMPEIDLDLEMLGNLSDPLGLDIGFDDPLPSLQQPRSTTPVETPESSKDSTSTRESDISESDNLNIDISMDVPSMNVDSLMLGSTDAMNFQLDDLMDLGTEDTVVVQPGVDWANAKWEDLFPADAGLKAQDQF